MKFNGNLVGNSDGTSELRSVSIEKLATAAETSLASGLSASHTGRIIYNTDGDVYKYWDGTVFVAFATGGDASALETKVDALITSGGYASTADGTFDPTQLNALTNITGLTTGDDLIDGLAQLDSAIAAAAGVDTLPELTDVTVSGAAANDFIVSNGGGTTYVNLNGSAARTAMGVAIGTDVQAYDADLDAIAALTPTDSNFIVGNGAAWVTETGATVRTSLDVYSTTEIDSAIAAVVLDDVFDVTAATVTTGHVMYKSAGDFVFAAPGATSGVQAHDAGLDSIAGLTTAADTMIYTTALDTYATTTITSAARTVLDDASVADMRTTLGLVSGGTGDIWLDVAGDTMAGNIAMGGNVVSGLGAPTADTDAATKGYVDASLAGLTWKNSVVAASDTNITLDNTTTAVDGITLADGDRVLVMGQTDASENGIYDSSTSGAWTRSSDFDSVTPVDEINGAAVYVEQGSTSGDAGFTVTSQVAIVDTDDIDFTQFNGASAVVAGIGLDKSGNTLSVNMGAGIAQLPSDEVGIDLYDAAAGALILTADGSTRGTLTGDALHLLLDSTTLVQGANGLKVDAAGITAVEINSSVAGDGLQGGSGTVLSVDGVASIFEFTTGELDLVDGGVTNAHLANSDMTFIGDTGTSDVALGGTFDIAGGTGMTTVGTASTVTVNLDANADDLNDVPAPVLSTLLIRNAGNTAYETITAAGLLATANLGDLADVDETSVDAAGDGDLLIHDGTDFKAAKAFFLYTSGAANTSHTVTHSLGQQYCNVTVIDSSDEMVIPQSVTFTSTTALTVTFNSSIDCKVVVMGIA